MDNELVALPFCDGPKLLPFKLRQVHNIELIEVLGMGWHSFVFKAKIGQEVYALKVFGYNGWDFKVNSIDNRIVDREAWAVVGQYDLPFNAECRAYGRLKETGHEDLAVQCHGYITLTEEQIEEVCKHAPNNRPFTAFRSCWSAADGTPAPMRALVKDLGELTEPSLQLGLGAFETVKKLHQLGIFSLDVKDGQFINGKICDFSVARTLPHYSANPELNPLLPADWVPICADNTWSLCHLDYWAVWDMAHLWVLSDFIQDEAEADQVVLQLLNPLGHCVRGYKSPHTGREYPKFVHCDPRNGPWKQLKRLTARKKTSSSSANNNNNNNNRVTKLKLSKRPKRWERDTQAEEALHWVNQSYWRGRHSWNWHYDHTSGFVFPKGTRKMLKVINGKAEVCDVERRSSVTAEEREAADKIVPEPPHPNLVIHNPNLKRIVCEIPSHIPMKRSICRPHPLKMDRTATSLEVHTQHDDIADGIVRKLIADTLGYKSDEYYIHYPGLFS